MPRVMWSGSISFGLVNIPVKLYSAVSRKTVHFNQLDSATNSRVKQKRVSAETGDEVPYEQIVKGYELAGGSYVVVTDDELAALDPGDGEGRRRRRRVQVGLIVGTGGFRRGAGRRRVVGRVHG